MVRSTKRKKVRGIFLMIRIEEYGIVGTPGSGFGENGEGYFRLTGFGKREDAESIKLK